MAANALFELESLFERLARELPTGAADLRMCDSQHGDGKVFEFNPTNPAAAPFGVYTDGSDYYTFNFGLRSYWEFPYERRYRYDEKDAVTEIEEMARAVIGGDCEEIGGHFSITGKIYVPGHTYKTTTIPVLSLRRFGTRRYAPYASARVNC